MKSVAKYCKTFLLLIAVYFVFGVLSCWLPDKSIKHHIAESAPVIAAEGNYPKAIMGVEQCQMDNFTDALIMNQIYNIDRKHPVRSSMRMIRMSEKGGDWNQTGLLQRSVNGETLMEQHYARYWHGGSFFYRPFFMLMDYTTMRFVLYIVSSILLLILAFIYYQKAGWVKTLALSAGFLLTYGFVTQFSLQLFPVMALTVIASILVIKKCQSNDCMMLFFVVGSLACYCDLLTTPLLTLGVPLAIMLSLSDDAQFDVRDNLIKITKLTLLWGLGFALTFVTKWALATLVLGQNIFTDAYGVAIYRMEADEFTRWDAIVKNFEMLNLWIIGIAMVLLVVFNVLIHKKFNCKKAILFFVLALSPYVWYFILSNHSYIHWWFTYRLQAVTIVSVLLLLAEPFSSFFKKQELS